jgi:hypothetical protein
VWDRKVYVVNALKKSNAGHQRDVYAHRLIGIESPHVTTLRRRGVDWSFDWKEARKRVRRVLPLHELYTRISHSTPTPHATHHILFLPTSECSLYHSPERLLNPHVLLTNCWHARITVHLRHTTSNAANQVRPTRTATTRRIMFQHTCPTFSENVDFDYCTGFEQTLLLDTDGARPSL